MLVNKINHSTSEILVNKMIFFGPGTKIQVISVLVVNMFIICVARVTERETSSVLESFSQKPKIKFSVTAKRKS